MVLVRDGNGRLWYIDRWNHVVLYHDPATPVDTILVGDFPDGFEATTEEFERAFAGHWKPTRRT